MSENAENQIGANDEGTGEAPQLEPTQFQEVQAKPADKPAPRFVPGKDQHAPPAQAPIAENTPTNLGMLLNVNLLLTVELGRTSLSVRQVLDLQKGAVVELERIAGEAVDVFVNDRLIARGDVVVVDDKFGVRITELINPNPAQ